MAKKFFSPLLTLIAFILWSVAVFSLPAVSQADRSLYHKAEALAHPTWVSVNHVVSFLGKGEFFFPCAFLFMLYLFRLRFFRGGVFYFLSLVAGMELNAKLKIFFGRPRPPGLWGESGWTSLSYPSGHAFGSLIFYFLTAGVLLRVFPVLGRGPLWFAIGVLVFLIGSSRVTLGAHWASDVVGGYLLGLTWVFSARVVDEKFQPFWSRVTA